MGDLRSAGGLLELMRQPGIGPDSGPCPMQDFADPVFGEDLGRPTPSGVAPF